MVIAGRSVHLTTLFPGQAWTSSLPVLLAHTFACNWQQPFLNDSAEGRRMTVEIISWSISTKVWDRAGIELATPGSAVRLASVARHVTDCATRPGEKVWSEHDHSYWLGCKESNQTKKKQTMYSTLIFEQLGTLPTLFSFILVLQMLISNKYLIGYFGFWIGYICKC